MVDSPRLIASLSALLRPTRGNSVNRFYLNHCQQPLRAG
jgi:hypothetical protein